MNKSKRDHSNKRTEEKENLACFENIDLRANTNELDSYRTPHYNNLMMEPVDPLTLDIQNHHHGIQGMPSSNIGIV